MTQESVRNELMQVRAMLHVPTTGEVREVNENLAAIALVTSDFDGMQEAVLAHGGKFAYWSVLETIAADEEQTAKDALDAFEADALSRSDDAGTVTKAKAQMKIDPRWKQLHDAWRAAQRTAALIKVGRKTVEEHKDGLREAGQNFRAEMEYLLQVRERRLPAGSPEAEAAERRMRAFVEKRRAK